MCLRPRVLPNAVRGAPEACGGVLGARQAQAFRVRGGSLLASSSWVILR
jgi:hypothetical protein